MILFLIGTHAELNILEQLGPKFIAIRKYCSMEIEERYEYYL